MKNKFGEFDEFWTKKCDFEKVLKKKVPPPPT